MAGIPNDLTPVPADLTPVPADLTPVPSDLAPAPAKPSAADQAAAIEQKRAAREPLTDFLAHNVGTLIGATLFPKETQVLEPAIKPAENVLAPITREILAGGGKIGDTAAQVIPPIVGAIAGTIGAPAYGTYTMGSAGGAGGDALAQLRQYLRGERDTVSWGQLGTSAALGGAPVPAAALGKPIEMIGARMIQGAAIGGGANTAQQLIDTGTMDWGQLAESAGVGAIFGGGLGTAESLVARNLAIKGIRATDAFKDFKGTDAELVDAVRTKLQAESVVPEKNVTPGAPGQEAPGGALTEAPPVAEPAPADLTPVPSRSMAMATEPEESITGEPAPENSGPVPPPPAIPEGPPPAAGELPAPGRGGYFTSIKNAQVDAEREARGLQPLYAPAAQAWPDTWDQAMAQIDQNPMAPSNLLDDLSTKPRAVTAVEGALLDYTRVARGLAFREAAANVNANPGDPTAMTAYAQASDAMQEIDEIGHTAGSETGRSLAFRKAMIADDFSVENLTTQMRADLGGRQLTPPEIQQVQQTSDAVMQALADQQDRQNQLAKGDAQQAGQQMIQSLAKAPVQPEPGDPGLNREATIKAISEKVEAGDLDISTLAQKLARQFVAQGVRGVDPLIDAVHGVLSQIVPDLERGETMDAISGYGRFKPLKQDDVSVILRDLKGQMQQKGKLASMEAGEAPKKTGVERRVPTDAERALIKQVNEAKKRGGYTVTDPARQLRTAQQARTTRLTNQISDLERQIAARKRDVPTSTTLAVDAGTQTLIDRRNALQKELDLVAPKEVRDQTETRLQAQIDDLEKQIRNETVFDPEKKTPATSPKIEAMRAQIEELKARRAAMRESINPKDQDAARQRILADTLAYWQRKLDTKDFTPRSRPVATSVDMKSVHLQNKINAVKQAWMKERVKNQMANRSLPQKAMDSAVNYSRMVKLASVTVIPKLLMSGLGEVIVNPLTKPGGQLLRVIPGFAAKAPYELGWSVRGEVANLVGILTSAQAMKSALTTGSTSIDAILGNLGRDPEFMNYVGWVHKALKEPVRQGAFARSMAYRNALAARMEQEVHDPIVQTAIVTAAAQDADREIFSGKNLGSQSFRVAMAYMNSQGDAGKALSATIRMILPIINIPTNLAIANARLVPFIGISEALMRLAQAAKNGELGDNCAGLDPEDARKISVAWKLGLAGLFIGAYAWTHSKDFGGIYGEGPEHENRMKPGQIRVPDWVPVIGGDVSPAWLNAHPVAMFASMCASANRIYRKNLAAGKGTANALIDAAAFSMLCPVRELPYADEVLRLFGTTNSGGQIAGQFTRDAVIPTTLTRTLDLMDSVQRKPQSFTDEWKMANPWQRSEVHAAPYRMQPIPQPPALAPLR